jgi:hypothetical protein
MCTCFALFTKSVKLTDKLIFIPPIAPHPLSSTIWSWYNKDSSDRSNKWTQSVSPTKNTVTCWLVTRQIICGFWILCSVYWIYTRLNLQLIIYYTHNLTVNTLRSFFTDWPLIFLCAPNPNSLSSLRASAVTNIHSYCIHYFELQLKAAFMLARTKLADFSVVTSRTTILL